MIRLTGENILALLNRETPGWAKASRLDWTADGISTDTRTIHPGDLFVIDAGVIHCTSPDVPAEYSRNKLLFDRPVLAEDEALVALMPEAALALRRPDHILPLSGIEQLLGTLEPSA